MTRQAVVSDRFYPGDPSTLKQTLAQLIPAVSDDKKQQAKAVISPHAGYVYSGAVAGETFAHVRAVVSRWPWGVPTGICPWGGCLLNVNLQLPFSAIQR